MELLDAGCIGGCVVLGEVTDIGTQLNGQHLLGEFGQYVEVMVERELGQWKYCFIARLLPGHFVVQVEDTEAEKARVEAAKTAACEQLQAIYEKALKEVGETNAQIFEIHMMMLEDEDYNESIANIIETQKVNAEYAVAVTADNFAEMFSSMDDAYMQGRAADVKDISERVIRVLSQKEEKVNTSGAEKEKYIIAADDLAPSETVQLDKSKVLAFVTRHGSTNSHTAILARTMNIPALIGVDFPEEGADGQFGIVDGFDAKFFVEPDEDTKAEYRKLKEENEQKKRLLQELKGKENITKDGTKIMSINLLLPEEDDPVIWRGPVISGVVTQFWTDVAWGELDYLFVDMPPGTGDVPLTVFQSLPVEGIVIVTSPQDLVRMIVKKAYNMAGQMDIPVLGIVENYSYLECPDCGRKISVFGESHIDEVAEELGVPVIGKMPIDASLAEAVENENFAEVSNDYLAEAVNKL